MQKHVFLRRAAVRAVVCEIVGLGVSATEPPEVGPGKELPGEFLVHRPDIADGELGQRLVRDEPTLAINADDFDTGTTLLAGNCGRHHVRLTRGNVESVVVLDG